MRNEPEDFAADYRAKGSTTPASAAEGDPHHSLAAAGAADDRTRDLKYGDTFAVFDHFGQIKPGGLGEEGLYHEGTRCLSCLLLELDGRRPVFIWSTIRNENDQLAVAVTNPDEIQAGRVVSLLGTLHLALRALLWLGTCLRPSRVKNETNFGAEWAGSAHALTTLRRGGHTAPANIVPRQEPRFASRINLNPFPASGGTQRSPRLLLLCRKATHLVRSRKANPVSKPRQTQGQTTGCVFRANRKPTWL